MLELEHSVNAPVASEPLQERRASGLRRRIRPGETFIQILLFLCACVSIATTFSIVIVLSREALSFFTEAGVSVGQFLTGTTWRPGAGHFGVLPLVNATILTSLIAMLVALPLGLGAALYLSEYASARIRGVLKPTLELLAGIPTVVYGYFALTFVTPLLRRVLGAETVQIYNMLSAGIVVGILITPLVATLSEDALSAVPDGLRNASFGLGATRWETAIKVVFPAASSGVIAACMVAMARAMGETMVVALAAGASPNLSLNPFEPAETMTGHIARISGGDLSYGTIDYQSLFAIGLLLFGMTLLLNILSRWVVRHVREVYD
ncbi:MAG: phosphate ABC transporter permease subunit PstC [Chloroflexi bacterium OHK40]